MSQQKVDQYKEYKKNRKENLKKEAAAKKRNSLIGYIVGGVLALGLVVALAVTGVNGIKNKLAAKPSYEREEFVLSDVAGILESETETASAAESTEASSEASSETAASEAASSQAAN